MSMNNEGLQQAFTSEGDDVWLVFLKIEHAALTDGPLYLVRNTEDVSGHEVGKTHRGIMFDIVLPGQHERQASIASINIPNVDRKITDAIRPLSKSDKAVVVTVTVALASAPSIVQHGPWKMHLRNVSWTAANVTASMVPVVDLDQAWPAMKMDYARFPGLYYS